MWLDRSFLPNPDSKHPGHLGEVWMVHGGGFYHVEKLQMGPTKVPTDLHWFKWEAYWTWMSGFFLICMIFYTDGGSFLLDPAVSSLAYGQGVLLGLFSLIGSWFFYDFLWERASIRKTPLVGHILTLAWFAGMAYGLCHLMSGRAAYMHIGGMLGTWMTANVFMRIIPRQLKMVEASKRGEPVNQDWGKNAKNRSTHNTYFTLPVIFIMLSNHFPSTYGHEWNWLILLGLSAAGAAIREYFVVRLSKPTRSKIFGVIGALLILVVMVATHDPGTVSQQVPQPKLAVQSVEMPVIDSSKLYQIEGGVRFEGHPPARKKIHLPQGCAPGNEGLSNEVLVDQGKIENVLIRITQGHESLPKQETPKETVVIDQKGCLYRPRVAAVRVGQPVAFVNSDAVFHNVKGVAANNGRFNLLMPKRDQRETKVFNKPDLFLKTTCSIHPWMGAYIAVMEHPWFAVTDNQGRFTLKGLPSGTYKVEAWHEVFGTQSRTVTLGDGGVEHFDFVYKEAP